MNFKKGEEKFVVANVMPANPREIAVILSATYELYNSNGMLVDSGVCQIHDSEVSAQIKTEKCGTYKLCYTVRVGAETVKESVQIFVCE